MVLFQDGKPVHMIRRSDIDRRDAFQIAQLVTTTFSRVCSARTLSKAAPAAAW